MNRFKLKICTEQNYQNLSIKDEYTLYITSDKNNGYLGNKKLWITKDDLESKTGTI